MATKPTTIYNRLLSSSQIYNRLLSSSPDSVGEVERVIRSDLAGFDLEGVKDTEEIPFP